MITVYSKKTFIFNNNDRDEKGLLKFTKVNIGYNEIPESITKTLMFKMASSDDDIKIVNIDSTAEELLDENFKSFDSISDEKRGQYRKLVDEILFVNHKSNKNNIQKSVDAWKLKGEKMLKGIYS